MTLHINELVIVDVDANISYCDYKKGRLYKIDEFHDRDVILTNPIDGYRGNYIKRSDLKKVTKTMIGIALNKKSAILQSDIGLIKEMQDHVNENITDDVVDDVLDFIQIEEAGTTEDIRRMISNVTNTEKFIGLLGSLNHPDLEY